MKKRSIFYSNVEKIRLYYHVLNFAINWPMFPMISDPGSEHPGPILLPWPNLCALSSSSLGEERVWKVKTNARNIACNCRRTLTRSYISFDWLKIVNARILGGYLCIFYSLRLRCGVITEPMSDGLGLQVKPVLTRDGNMIPGEAAHDRDPAHP